MGVKKTKGGLAGAPCNGEMVCAKLCWRLWGPASHFPLRDWARWQSGAGPMTYYNPVGSGCANTKGANR